MTEKGYNLVTNKTALMIIYTAFSNVVYGEEFDISEEDYKEVVYLVSKMLDNTFRMIDHEKDGE